MKNKIFIMLFGLVFFLQGCKKEYEAPDFDPTIAFYTSSAQNANLVVGLNQYMTFMDLSQGAESHAWTIPEGSFFLEGPFIRQDNMEVFEERIINRGDTVTNEETAIVYFKKPGIQKVRLYNVYSDSVVFKGNRWSSALEARVDYDFPSEYINGKWVIDTIFEVKVYDTIVADIEVRKNGIVLDHTSKEDTIYVENGEFLEFVDNTVQGEPTNRTWKIRSNETQQTIGGSNDTPFNFLFKKLGVFTASIDISRIGDDIPSDFENYVLPSPIKVTKSSKPFLVSRAYELEDETIVVGFASEFNIDFNSEEPKEDSFEVKVNDVEFEIESVEIDSDDATLVKIKLKESIYNSDFVKVSFVDNTNYESVDTRNPVLFSDLIVSMNFENMLISSVNDGSAWQPWWTAAESAEVTYSADRAVVGGKSLKMVIKDGMPVASYRGPLADNVIIKSDEKYLVKYDIYIDSGQTTALPLNTQIFMVPDWSGPAVSVDLVGLDMDKWVTVEGEYFNLDGIALKNLYARIVSADSKSSAAVYFDNFRVFLKEERP